MRPAAAHHFTYILHTIPITSDMAEFELMLIVLLVRSRPDVHYRHQPVHELGLPEQHVCVMRPSVGTVHRAAGLRPGVRRLGRVAMQPDALVRIHGRRRKSVRAIPDHLRAVGRLAAHQRLRAAQSGDGAVLHGAGCKLMFHLFCRCIC